MDRSRDQEEVAALLEQAAYPRSAHYALAALQDVRAHFGHVPAAALPIIAGHMGMPLAAVEGLIRDSAQFVEKTAAHQLRVCQGAVCIGRGGGGLLEQARRMFGEQPGLQVAAGHCLGYCTQAPAVSLDGHVLAPADPESMQQLVESGA